MMEVWAIGAELLMRTSPLADGLGRFQTFTPGPLVTLSWLWTKCTSVTNLAPVALTRKNDLAVMERLKFPSVRNADDGCCAEFLGQDFHHTILADGIQG
jgi:hypothetical protein